MILWRCSSLKIFPSLISVCLIRRLNRLLSAAYCIHGPLLASRHTSAGQSFSLCTITRSSNLTVLPTCIRIVMPSMSYCRIQGLSISRCNVDSTCIARGLHVFSTWISRGCHVVITWISRGLNVFSTWISREYHVVITWMSRGFHVFITWISRGCHVGITWLSRRCHVDITWLSHGYHVDVTFIDITTTA
jgi:hypothetical protein